MPAPEHQPRPAGEITEGRNVAFHVVNTRVELLAEAARPKTGEVLVIPANDHLWMLSGPGLELKKAHGKEIEIEAVRHGPVNPGSLVATSGLAAGYRLLFHAVIMGQDMNWVDGAGQLVVSAVLERAVREKATTLVVYPLYLGVHGRREGPAREMLAGLLGGLESGSTIRTVTLLCGQPEEKTLLHETFLRLLNSPRP
jgi:hypothetical protein